MINKKFHFIKVKIDLMVERIFCFKWLFKMRRDFISDECIDYVYDWICV